jgi:type II secretory pathway component GspD/PulD (secretin)
MLNVFVRSLLAGLCFLTLLPAAQAQPQVVEVITLGYRQADELIPMVRPLLAPGGTVTGMNNRLVIKTTPANLAEIKQVLSAVDAKPRQLIISVKQTTAAEAARGAGSVSGNVAIGSSAQVKVPRPPGSSNQPRVTVQSGNSQIEGRAVNSRSARDEGVTQTVQVLEGNDAFIRVGQSVPVSNTQVIRTPNGAQITQGTEFVSADTGFYVRPRVNGDQVTLEISTARDRLRNPSTGATNMQRVSTVVSGRLGEWIEIGGSSQTVERSQNQTLSRSRDARNEDRRVILKVDEVR